MNNNKKKRLQNKGWVVGDTTKFLNLSPEEVAYVELKLLLGKNLQNTRRQKKIIAPTCEVKYGTPYGKTTYEKSPPSIQSIWRIIQCQFDSANDNFALFRV